MAQVNLGIMVEVNSRNNQGWKLGTRDVRVKDQDIHKAVVLDNANEASMKLAADGEEIRGFIESVEPHTADGASFGTVTVHAPGVRAWVTASGALKIGDLVVSAAQTAAGAANALLKHPLDARGVTVVKKGTPANFKWQVIRQKGTDLFLIEAI